MYCRSWSSDFTSTPGRGVQAHVDGHLVGVASPGPLTLDDTPGRFVRRGEDAGHTAVVVTADERPWGSSRSPTSSATTPPAPSPP